MRNYITKDQWNVLNDKEKAKWIGFDFDFHWESGDSFFRNGEGSILVPSITRMIEFLGSWLVDITFSNANINITMWRGKRICGKPEDFIEFSSFSLCEALWEAVKHKLSKNR